MSHIENTLKEIGMKDQIKRLEILRGKLGIQLAHIQVQKEKCALDIEAIDLQIQNYDWAIKYLQQELEGENMDTIMESITDKLNKIKKGLGYTD